MPMPRSTQCPFQQRPDPTGAALRPALLPPQRAWRGLFGLTATWSSAACAAAPAPAGPAVSLWWFASLALAGLAIAGYALGRLNEGKARRTELFAARNRHAALLSVVQDTVWHTDAQHAWLQRNEPPEPPVIAAASAKRTTPAPPSAAPAWFTHTELQTLLRAQRAFQGLHLHTPAAAAVAATAGPAPPETTSWLLCGQPLLDHDGLFAGFLGTARPLAAQAGQAPPAHEGAASAAQAGWPAAAPADAHAAAALPALNASASVNPAATRAAAQQATPAENEEADNFSLTVAHDLRAPIRVVDGFTRIVKEDYGHLLDRVANDHLERVLSAAARMNKMIDALLTLSRLSNQPLTRQPVNLSRLALHVMDELQRAQPGRVVDISIEPELQVTGDPTLLRLVLENLLGNAWKYSGRTPKAQISLSTVRHGHGRAFVVRDNGAGFDMRSAERLFGVFQRLHSASEFPGHGVGLASVRRIVRRHGGDIWAEAEPARGAAFTFTLDEG